jgi:hypothetical protein
MKRWVVYATGTITLVTVVEADSEQEARALALERSPTGLAHQAELESEDSAWVTTGELDCDVQEENIVSVEEME